jgi:hypothetical protein
MTSIKELEQLRDTSNRRWRSIFVFLTVAVCLVIAGIMGFRTDLDTKVNEIVADGLISLAMFLSISYVAGSSLDYSGVLARFGSRPGVGRGMRPPPADAYAEQFVEPDQFRGGQG